MNDLSRLTTLAVLIGCCLGCERAADPVTSGATPSAAPAATQAANADVVVYGATPSGITSAVAAARAGRSVVILEPSAYVGGMMSGGLARTDIGRHGPDVFGGLTAEFFRRVQQIEGMRGACIGPCDSTYDVESHVAEQVFETLIREAGITLERSSRLVSVDKEGATITSVTTTRGTWSGRVFVDASYEGDLMARAHVSYRIGRDPRIDAASNDATALAFTEDHAGKQPYRLPLNIAIDPYRVPGDPSSGTIAYIDRPSDEPLLLGAGDSRVMAYIYRLCVTDDPGNQVPFTPPEGYDPADYEVHARLFAAAPPDVDVVRSMWNPSPIALSRDRRYRKYDLNGTFTFSTDLTAEGLNHDYVEASPERRAEIEREYRRYIQGLVYAWKTDPRFKPLNEQVATFGYCADEFADRDHWPHQLYVRVGRRMVGEYVMNENDVLQNGRRPPIEDPVAYGTYAMGTHAHQYLAAPMDWPDGTRRDAVVIAGVVIVGLPDNEPYAISYRSLTPFASEARNLLNPVTLSATNLAFTSIRMEPTLMMLGEAAGTAAALAIEAGSGVQDVSYATLRERLEANGQRASR